MHFMFDVTTDNLFGNVSCNIQTGKNKLYSSDVRIYIYIVGKQSTVWMICHNFITLIKIIFSYSLITN